MAWALVSSYEVPLAGVVLARRLSVTSDTATASTTEIAHGFPAGVTPFVLSYTATGSQTGSVTQFGVVSVGATYVVCDAVVEGGGTVAIAGDIWLIGLAQVQQDGQSISQDNNT